MNKKSIGDVFLPIALQVCQALAAWLLVANVVYGAGCDVNKSSVQSYSFGSYNSGVAFNTGVVSVGIFTVICRRDRKNTYIGLDAGIHISAGKRYLSAGSHTITYRLWQSSGASVEWGDKDFSNTYTAGTVNGPNKGSYSRVIYGTIISSVGVPPGVYTDRVTVLLWNKKKRLIFTKELTLSLNIIGECNIDASGVGGGFGRYPVTSSDILGMALGSVSVTCPATLPYRVGMAAGRYFNGTRRRMKNGTSNTFVPYILRASASGNEWGDAGLHAVDNTYTETHSAAAQFATGMGTPQTFYVWGDALISGSGAPAGIYNDLVTITVVW